MLFGLLSAPKSLDAARDKNETLAILSSMAAALRVTGAEQVKVWPAGPLGIGVIEHPFGGEDQLPEPAQANGSMLWMCGEAFEWPSEGGIRTAAYSRTAAFRLRVLDALLRRGHCRSRRRVPDRPLVAAGAYAAAVQRSFRGAADVPRRIFTRNRVRRQIGRASC